MFLKHIFINTNIYIKYICIYNNYSTNENNINISFQKDALRFTDHSVIPEMSVRVDLEG